MAGDHVFLAAYSPRVPVAVEAAPVGNRNRQSRLLCPNRRERHRLCGADRQADYCREQTQRKNFIHTLDQPLERAHFGSHDDIAVRALVTTGSYAWVWSQEQEEHRPEFVSICRAPAPPGCIVVLAHYNKNSGRSAFRFNRATGYIPVFRLGKATAFSVNAPVHDLAHWLRVGGGP